jgi:hypothetical protein
MSDGAIVIDTPDGIQAFFWLQVYHKLKMEVAMPSGPKWRVPPMKQAQMILQNAGIKPAGRKAKVLEQFGEYLTSVGILSS